ncbi:unnamed protein product, partial [Clonostachys chloroleuca]
MLGQDDSVSAVLLCSAVHAIGQIISHEMYRNWNNESMWDDPTWQNFTATFNEGTASLFNESFSDWAINNNSLTLDNDGGASKSYYWNTLPRELLSFTLITTLMYLWDISLEDLLPTRPRGVGADAKNEKAVYPNTPREETLGRLIVNQALEGHQSAGATPS